jgi:hypothetical protein
LREIPEADALHPAPNVPAARGLGTGGHSQERIADRAARGYAAATVVFRIS